MKIVGTPRAAGTGSRTNKRMKVRRVLVPDFDASDVTPVERPVKP
jgi:hypothetical protein